MRRLLLTLTDEDENWTERRHIKVPGDIHPRAVADAMESHVKDVWGEFLTADEIIEKHEAALP